MTAADSSGVTATVTAAWPGDIGTPGYRGEREWLTVTTACAMAGVSKRTLRRWIAENRVVSRLEGEPGRQVRSIRADTLPPVTATGAILGDDTGEDTPASLNQRDSTRPGDSTRADTRDDTADGPMATVTRQAEEIAFLRAQLESRTRAEEELRQLLALSQRALSVALERPALSLPDPVDTPKRVRWWAPWRR